MQYTRVHIESMAYELPPLVVTTEELEERLRPLYEKLHIPVGQLEQMTGIRERRWWAEGQPLADGTIAAARKALERSAVNASDLGAVLFCGVNRENFEPATACHVAAALNARGAVAVYDISNACLGLLNGILDVANRIELGQIRAGLVVSCETAREINETMITRMLANPTMDAFKTGLATITGGSGAVAYIITDASIAESGRRLTGAVALAAPEHYKLCHWGLETKDPTGLALPLMVTDSVAVLEHGVALGRETWVALLQTLQWEPDSIDRVICHQVGKGHQEGILKALGISLEKDFVTYPYLGNMGTVALPLTAAVAEERGELVPGQRVAFLGIGSGLNCMMMGLEW